MVDRSAGRGGVYGPEFILDVREEGGFARWHYRACIGHPSDGIATAGSVLRSGLLVSEECSFALVDNVDCLVIDQDFMAADCGDDWPELSVDVETRLMRSLVPTVSSRLRSLEGVKVGVCSTEVMRRSRPTFLVAIPSARVEPIVVHEIVDRVLRFAFPA